MSEKEINDKEKDMEENDDLVVLTDEEGNDIEFEWLDTIEMNNNRYLVVIPADDETDEVVILKVEEGEEEENFVAVEDEKELNEVFEEFKTKNKENYDFVD